MFRSFIVIILVTLMAFSSHAKNSDQVLQQLLRQARQQVDQIQQQDQQRLDQFRQEHQKQKQQLKQAQQLLQHLQLEAEELDKRYSENRSAIQQASNQLQSEKQQFNQLFNTIRMNGQELRELIVASPLALVLQQELADLAQLNQPDYIATSHDVKQLWQAYLHWLQLTSKPQQLEHSVIFTNGVEQSQRVNILASFNQFSQQEWLLYLPQSQRFIELLPQPNLSEFGKGILNTDAKNGLLRVLIDYRDGALMKQLSDKPDWQDHLTAGGWIGVVIIVLGVIGFVIVAQRFIALRKLRKQIDTEQQKLVDETTEQLTGLPLEVMEAGLAERLQQSLSPLNKGLTLISTLATIAPLLGLLGTVVGMIDTFQILMLYGNSDPKLLSGGISQALVTTEFGLLVAVPLVLCHSQLSSLNQQLQQHYEQIYLQIQSLLFAGIDGEGVNNHDLV